MKKFIVMLTLISLVESNLIAQEIKNDSIKNSFAEISMGFNLYSIQFSRPTAQVRIFYKITPKIAIGYGWGLEGWTEVDAGVDSDFPFNKLHISTLNYGRGVSSMYHFNHSYLGLDCYIALSDYNFQVYDNRYKHTYEDSDGNTNISHEFALHRADGKNWYSNVSVTLTLSYAIQICNIFYLKSSIGYDFIRPIRTELVNETVGISANWDEFNTYYGVPSMNLCEVSKGIGRICTMRKIHFGLCICLRV